MYFFKLGENDIHIGNASHVEDKEDAVEDSVAKRESLVLIVENENVVVVTQNRDGSTQHDYQQFSHHHKQGGYFVFVGEELQQYQ